MQPEADFEARFVALCEGQLPRLFRYLDRLSGDPDLAADLSQEALVRLYRRGSLPDAPEAWLVSVALNLLRNEANKRARRRRLLGRDLGARAHSDPPRGASEGVEADEERQRVRGALDRLPERDRRLLLLGAEGFGYREIAGILALRESSVGTLLARAREAFRREMCDAT